MRYLYAIIALILTVFLHKFAFLFDIAIANESVNLLKDGDELIQSKSNIALIGLIRTGIQCSIIFCVIKFILTFFKK